MEFKKNSDGVYEADLPIDLEVFDFAKGFNNIKLENAKILISKRANGQPKMELIFGFVQQEHMSTISMWGIGDSSQWPLTNLLNIVVDESNVYLNLVLSEGDTVIFTNNDIDKFLSFMTKANRDISRLKSWPAKNKMKDLYSSYQELNEVKEIIKSLMPKEEKKESNSFESVVLNANINKYLDNENKTIDFSKLSKEERLEVARQILVYRPIWSHEEYRAVINYMRMKHPDMTRGPHKIQWKYAKYQKEVEVVDGPTGIKSTMAATICYDAITKEPVGFSGVYYRPSSQYGVIQNGIVMFVDPNYRRMGIAQTFYTIQEEKLRRSGVRYCYEIQIGGNIQLSDKNGYIKLNKGRLRNDGTYSQVRYLIDSEDQKSVDRWNNLNANIDWESGLDTEFLKNKYKINNGEPFTIEELNSPWNE